MTWLLVKTADFGGLGWSRPGTLARFAETVAVPAYLDELSHLVRVHPLGIAVDDTGSVRLEALLSLSGRAFPFVRPDGRWLTAYTPAYVRQYPFGFRVLESGSVAICVDDESGLVKPATGMDVTPFFNDAGEPTAEFGQVKAFLSACHGSKQKTDRAVSLLSQLELLEPWIVEGEEGGESRRVRYYQVSEKKLEALEPGKLALLGRSGALKVAYAQILSQSRLALIDQLEKSLGKGGASTDDVDLDKLFGEDDDDVLSF